MEKQIPYYLKLLRKDFETRQSRNLSFSMRSYARFLGLEAPSLSGVLKGTRRISKTKVDTIVEKLGLSPKERTLFIESNANVLKQSLSQQTELSFVETYQLQEEAHFRVISEWEHYAILSLIETKDFKPNTTWIAERLNISTIKVENCIQNLKDANLIETKKDKITLSNKAVSTPEDIASKAARKASLQELSQAATKLEEVELLLRDFSSCTMTVNPTDLQELKQVIRDFRKKMMATAEFEPGTEVYKLNVQFYPVTKVRNLKK